MRRKAHIFIASLAALAVFTVFAPRSPAATPEQINQTIDKAQKYLFSMQKAGGHWEPAAHRTGDDHEDFRIMNGETFGGYTAIATYALLDSGVSANDSRIVQAVNFLKTADIIGNYALAMRLQVWLLLWRNSSPRDRGQYVDLANADAGRLIKGVHLNGPLEGLWTYLPPWAVPAEKGPHVDHSVSQYGILGLWAAERMGGEIDDRLWHTFDRRWRADQMPDGGWSYNCTPTIKPPDARPESASMTAAGIASLFIIQEYTGAGKRGIECSGNIANNNIDQALEWMRTHFNEVDDMYTFYGIERIGVASGYKYFGKIDWFSRIADRLVQAQTADGTWDGNDIAPFPGFNPIPAAAWGLLFLARGGAPVIINKLDYSITAGGKHHKANWNERPRDCYNLADWAGQQSEADLNWQVVNLTVSVKDLHDAPILYLAGDKELNLSEEDVTKLREFVTEGGLIFGNADCNSLPFKNSFIKLGAKLFPKYEFSQLNKGNIIFKEANAKFRGTPQLLGLSNGVRQLMLLSPIGDPSRAWQTKAVFGQNVDYFQLGFNIFLYSIDTKGLRKKGDSYLVEPDPNVQPNKTINLARLMVGDNPDPEPGGWPRLSAVMHNDPYRLDLKVTEIKPGAPLASYQIVDLTGTTAFKLNADERADLLQFTQKGGTLIIDAAGGSGAFADSAETELANIFGKDAAAAALASLLPLDNRVFHLSNADIKSVTFRQFARKNLVGRYDAPHIHGIDVNKRIVAFYSREDLTAGLVGEQVDGIYGYSPDSATAIMRNLVLYGAGEK